MRTPLISLRALSVLLIAGQAMIFAVTGCAKSADDPAAPHALGQDYHDAAAPTPTAQGGNAGTNQPEEQNPPDLAIPPDAGQGNENTCHNLECQQTSCTAGPCAQVACEDGQSTTVSGIVHDPSGQLPLYNVTVYVPNAAIRPFAAGVNCDSCELTQEQPLAAAITDEFGRFELTDVPVGSAIPLVVQIGKWRRQLEISVDPCVDNSIDADQTRLPRNQLEGDIPLIAITTGGADSMECLPRRLGIDDIEFTSGTGEGRIHLYRGIEDTDMDAADTFSATLNDGASFLAADELWASPATLTKYDLVVLSCEGFLDVKSQGSRDAMYEYASLGGRIFASHWHHSWFSMGPDPVPQIGTWSDRVDPLVSPLVATINTSFPKGEALARWLLNVGATTTLGQMEINEARDNIQAIDPMLATEWMTASNDQYPDAPAAVEYLSFNAPLDVAPEAQCGRAVYTDLHVSSTGADVPGAPFPEGCEERELSAEEKAVAFMLFDLSACLIPDHEPPKPPEIIR